MEHDADKVQNRSINISSVKYNPKNISVEREEKYPKFKVMMMYIVMIFLRFVKHHDKITELPISLHSNNSALISLARPDYSTVKHRGLAYDLQISDTVIYGNISVMETSV